MVKRWLPTDQFLKRALAGLLAGVLLAVLAGAVGAWNDEQYGWPEEAIKVLDQTVWQYGASSPEAAAALKQLGETKGPKDVVALLDPTTGKAVAAWPADLTGKTPQEMTLSGNVKLPALTQMEYRNHFTLRRPGAAKPAAFAAYETDKVAVQLTPLYPWLQQPMVSSEHGGGPDGKPYREHRSGGEGKRWGRGEAGIMAPPQAYLLLAAPPAGITPLAVVAGGLGALAALGFVIYGLSLAWWGYTDARRRGGKAFAWGVLILLTNLVGVAVYLVARRERRDCPSCGVNAIEKGFRYCPHCGHDLKPACAECGQPLRDGWAFCVACGAARTDSSVTPEE